MTFFIQRGVIKRAFYVIPSLQNDPSHSELSLGSRKISEWNRMYTKWKFENSDGIIVFYFCDFNGILVKFDNFEIGVRDHS